MTNSLNVVIPVQITDAILTSTDVPETDYTAYNSGTTYALGDRCIITATHKVWESLQAGNLNNAPASSATWWVEVSPTNRWKCFDTSNSTQTAQATSAQYVLTPAQSISTLALLNITDGVSLRVRMDDPTYGSVYDSTLYTSKILSDSSWYAFFIGVKGSLSSVTVSDLPAYPSAVTTVDITGSADLAFGVLMLGQARSLGQGVMHGVRVGIQDYSRKETNDWGDTVLVQRAYAKRATFNIRLNRQEVDLVTDYLAQLRTTPCLWVGSTQYTTTMIFGIYQDFETTIQYFDSSECSLNLLGLT